MEMNILDCLIESFDTQPVNFRRIRDVQNDQVDYEFEVDSNKYSVNIDLIKYPGMFDVDFALRNGSQFDFGVTGTGNATTVLNTVIEIIKDFIRAREQENLPVISLRLSSSKINDTGSTRSNVYQRLINRELNKNNIPGEWKVNKFDSKVKTIFLLKRKFDK